MTGRTFFHYQFGERLGASGRGEVYEAHDSKLGYGNAIPSMASRIDLARPGGRNPNGGKQTVWRGC
jgi:hypothetical protein